MDLRKAVFLALVVGVFGGCVALPHTPDPRSAALHPVAPEGFPVHIAVLPVFNATSDSDGPVIVRAFVIRKLSRDLGFIATSTDKIDQELAGRDLIWSGHPQGRQLLSKQDPAVLASWLGVEGVLYVDLGAYSRQKISIYAESKATVHCRLVNAAGIKMWESKSGDVKGGGLSMGSASMDSILGDASLSGDVQDRIRRSDPAPAAFDAVEAALSDFPQRR